MAGGSNEIRLIRAIRIDDSPTSYTSRWVDIGAYDKVTVAIVSTKILSPTNVIYTFEGNIGSTKKAADADGIEGPSDGTAAAIDVVIATGGDDAPVASVTHTATTTAWVVLYPGFTCRWFRVKATGTGTDATNFFDSTVTLFGQS